jgi:membrane protease YdiL (CAAX protease family)
VRSRPLAPSPNATASLPAFFALVFALSVPFWIVGAVTDLKLPPDLPVSALQALVPVVAALLLVWRASGTAGVRRFVKRCDDSSRTRSRIWYVPLLLLAPGMTVVTFFVMRVIGLPRPAPQFALGAIPAMFVAFLVFALAEEFGWSGYATDPMQTRWGVLRTGIRLGLVWAAWQSSHSYERIARRHGLPDGVSARWPTVSSSSSSGFTRPRGGAYSPRRCITRR